MKIVEVSRFGGPEVLELIELPDPKPEAGQIVVEVKAAGINFADVMARQGDYSGVKSAPFRPGYEVAGIVTAVGEGVTNFRGDEHVMAMLPGMGGYATHVALNAAEAIPIPDGLDFGAATALLVQGLTAYFLLEAGDLQAGKSVLIPGAGGGLGSLAIQIAKLKGAGKVIGLASPSKHDLVRSLGADVALDYTRSGWAQNVVMATDGNGVDIFLDSQGDLAGEGFEALGQKAHWLVFGMQAEKSNALSVERFGAMIGKNISLRGYMVFGDVAGFGRALGEMIGWALNGQLKISVESFPLAEVASAHEAISNRKTTGKVVLVP